MNPDYEIIGEHSSFPSCAAEEPKRVAGVQTNRKNKSEQEKSTDLILCFFSAFSQKKDFKLWAIKKRKFLLY